MKKDIFLLDCGTNVETIVGKFYGIITGINIRFDRIQYEVSYCVDSDIKTIWLTENEVNVSSKSEKQKIGYK